MWSYRETWEWTTGNGGTETCWGNCVFEKDECSVEGRCWFWSLLYFGWVGLVWLADFFLFFCNVDAVGGDFESAEKVGCVGVMWFGGESKREILCMLENYMEYLNGHGGGLWNYTPKVLCSLMMYHGERHWPQQVYMCPSSSKSTTTPHLYVSKHQPKSTIYAYTNRNHYIHKRPVLKLGFPRGKSRVSSQPQPFHFLP